MVTHRFTLAFTVVLLSFASAAAVSAAAPEEGPLGDAARAIVAQVRSEPDVAALKAVLGEAFLEAVPAKKLAELLAGVAKEHGAATGLRLEEAKGESSGVFEVSLPDGFAFPLTVSVAGEAPHLIRGLWMGAVHPLTDTWEKIFAGFRELPGKVGFMLARLDEDITPLHVLNPDEVFAIGSTFKLYVLGALLEGRIPWDRVLRLEERDRSLPSGVLQKWPVGSPLTVHSLATQMISISDNTATDTLIRFLGREVVERQLGKMGNAHPRRTMPFLTTREMFVLATREKLRRRYLDADLTARRGLLAGALRGVSPDIESIPEVPGAIGVTEWFASARDLVRTMDWLRRRGDETVRGILGVNRGLSVSEESFPYAGYKGGSDWGVLNQTWLLRHRSGSWYVLTGSWNDPDAVLDNGRLYGLLQRAIDLLAEEG